MNYKKVIIIIGLALLFQAETMCQCTTTLSKSGNAHWRAAEALMGMASTADDYEQVAIELKQVAESDPNYAPVYMKLGKLYTQIGNDKGESAFDLAEYYYDRCQEVCSDSADAVVVEMAILNALRRKFANGPNRFVGTWGRWYEGEFTPNVEISYNGSGYSFRVVGFYANQSNFSVESQSANEIIFTYTSVFDKRDELRKKGWTKYYDDCNGYADPGYPQSGKYYYNEEKVKYRLSYAIEGEMVVLKYLMIHTDYYLNGQKTYADTETNFFRPNKLVKYQ